MPCAGIAAWVLLLERLLAALWRVWVREILDPECGVRGERRDGREARGDHPGDGDGVLLRGRRQRHGGVTQQSCVV